MILKRCGQPSKVALLLAVVPLAGSSRALCFGSSTARVDTHRLPNTTTSQFQRLVQRQPFLQHGPVFREHTSDARIESKLRGGSQKENESLEEEQEPEAREEKWRRRGMTLALTSTYLTVMAAKCALPSVLALLTSSKTGLTYPNLSVDVTAQSLMARLLGLSTLGIAMGKLLLGPVIDNLGGIRSLQLALISLTALILGISCTQQFSLFAVCYILVDFIFSSCWASCINAIHQSFPEKEWGRQIGMLAAGARTGNAAAFALFASILYGMENKMKQPWRIIFGVSALLQLVPLSLLSHFGGRTLNQKTTKLHIEERPSIKSSLVTLRREASTPVFWLHATSRSALMVFASFLLFVPTLMSQVYGSSNAFAAQTGSIYALGCLLSVTTGSQLYSRLPKKSQALAVFGLLGTATLSSLAQLAHVAGVWSISASTSAAFMFLWGWAFAIPFYIPPSLYALSRGGVRSSATIADVFDIGGFASLALFNGYVASIQHARAAAWIPTFLITTACSLTSLISLTMAVLLQ
jgi:MFS family permease